MKMTNGEVTIECTPLTKNVWVRNGFEEVEETEEGELTWQELKTLAKERGINTKGMKKEEVIEALK